MKAYLRILITFVVLPGIFLMSECSAKKKRLGHYPAFITSNEDYYITRIGSVPQIDGNTYLLTIKGLVKNPRTFTLEELKKLPMVELPLTVECIGNTVNGSLLSTAIWKGFRLYDLLDSLGLDDKATGVQYRAPDGYYASHIMEQIKTNGVIGALYMNGVVIPPRQGFPLRFLNPGYYGVKQPAWVTEVEVIDRPVKDYWEDRGWDCSPPIPIDATIFFPKDGVQVKIGQALEVGGAAFGGTRVAKVEVTKDKGKSWQDAEIVNSMDVDNVWVFWKTALVFSEKGKISVNVRATDIHGNTQQETDPDRYDGTDDWPLLIVDVVE